MAHGEDVGSPRGSGLTGRRLVLFSIEMGPGSFCRGGGKVAKGLAPGGGRGATLDRGPVRECGDFGATRLLGVASAVEAEGLMDPREVGFFQAGESCRGRDLGRRVSMRVAQGCLLRLWAVGGEAAVYNVLSPPEGLRSCEAERFCRGCGGCPEHRDGVGLGDPGGKEGAWRFIATDLQELRRRRSARSHGNAGLLMEAACAGRAAISRICRV